MPTRTRLPPRAHPFVLGVYFRSSGYTGPLSESRAGSVQRPPSLRARSERRKAVTTRGGHGDASTAASRRLRRRCRRSRPGWRAAAASVRGSPMTVNRYGAGATRPVDSEPTALVVDEVGRGDHPHRAELDRLGPGVPQLLAARRGARRRARCASGRVIVSTMPGPVAAACRPGCPASWPASCLVEGCLPLVAPPSNRARSPAASAISVRSRSPRALRSFRMPTRSSCRAPQPAARPPGCAPA